MKALKFTSALTLLCGILLLSSCLGDGGNTMSVYSTGSIYKTNTGTNYMYVDYTGMLVTSTELQNEDFAAGDRLMATVSIDFDNQGTQVADYIYNATISGIHKFDCNSYIFDNTMKQYQSDTISTLYSLQPFINYRKDDTILTFAYLKDEVESGDPSSLKLIQPKQFDNSSKTDTLYLVYDKGEHVKESKTSEYVSFKLPVYPFNTDIQVVIRYKADNSNFTQVGSDKTSKYFSFTYNRPESLIE